MQGVPHIANRCCCSRRHTTGAAARDERKPDRFCRRCTQAAGLPGCVVDPQSFTSIWINYTPGVISVGTGPIGTSITFQWRDPDTAIPDIRHIGLSCWDKHISYRNVQLLPAIPAADLQQQVQRLQHQQQQDAQLTPLAQQGQGNSLQQLSTQAGLVNGQQANPSPFSKQQEQYHRVPPLLQLVQDSLQSTLTPSSLFHVLHLSELLLPRTQPLYEAAVQFAGSWFNLLVQQHLDEMAGLSVDVLADILQEPLLVRGVNSLLLALASTFNHHLSPHRETHVINCFESY